MVRGNCLYSCIADLSTDEVSFSEAQPIFVRQVSTLSLVAMSATRSRSQTGSMVFAYATLHQFSESCTSSHSATVVLGFVIFLVSKQGAVSKSNQTFNT